MNNKKKENLSLGIFLVCMFLIGFIFFASLRNNLEVMSIYGEKVLVSVSSYFTIASTIFLMLLSFVSAICVYFYFNVFSKDLILKRKQKTALNFLERDNKRVFEYLVNIENNECLQKDLIYELKINRVKLTRVLDYLTEKNLIKRISYGKTNKIVLVG